MVLSGSTKRTCEAHNVGPFGRSASELDGVIDGLRAAIGPEERVQVRWHDGLHFCDELLLRGVAP